MRQKDGLLAKLQVKMSRIFQFFLFFFSECNQAPSIYPSCQFWLFLPHEYQVSLM